MTLLKAMAILNNQNIKLILIGDGEEETLCANLQMPRS
jgi:hypothetical protein